MGVVRLRGGCVPQDKQSIGGGQAGAMNTVRTMLMALGIGLSLPVVAQDWEAADRATTRLAPAMFVNLPADIRAELARRGCAVLCVATPRYIRDHYREYGGPKPPALDHDGINDLVIEKGSLVWYWYQNRWLELQGAD
jgi:hypothetical protein